MTISTRLECVFLLIRHALGKEHRFVSEVICQQGRRTKFASRDIIRLNGIFIELSAKKVVPCFEHLEVVAGATIR